MPATQSLTMRLAPLVLGVLLMHALGLEWLAQQGTGPGALALMAEPEFTQALTPSNTQPSPAISTLDAPTPPPSTAGQVVQARHLVLPTAPKAKARAAATPNAKPVNKTHAEAPEPPPHGQTSPNAPHAGTEPAPDQTPDPPAPQPSPDHTSVTSAGEPAHRPVPQNTSPATDGTGTPAPSGTPSGNTWLLAWPASTRLSYQLQGYFRGEFSGDARVLWQRTAERYQAQVDVSVALLLNMRMTSQGRITPTHLWPEAYEEDRRGKKRGARFGDQEIQLDNGNTLPRPPHLQDAASQFVQLAQDFATGRRLLVVGEVIHLTLGRPGGVDDWAYDVVAQDTLHTPLGELEAFHLKPRPLANPRGKVYAEMWFAPALQYLPARIRLTLNEDTWLDLTLTAVAQSP